MSDTIFADGMIVKAPREGAPSFVKAAVSIKVDEFIAFLQRNRKADGWVNLDLKESAKEGHKWYAALNTFSKGEAPKPQAEATDVNPDDIPF